MNLFVDDFNKVGICYSFAARNFMPQQVLDSRWRSVGLHVEEKILASANHKPGAGLTRAAAGNHRRRPEVKPAPAWVKPAPVWRRPA